MFISISLKQQDRETLQAFEERIVLRDEVMECYPMTGDTDYLLRVAVPDMPAPEHFKMLLLIVQHFSASLEAFA